MSKPWYPSISAKQAGIINDWDHPYILLSGPRRATKTIGGLNLICHHLWTTQDASVSIVGRTLTDNFDGGAWDQLFKWVMPEWIEGRSAPPHWPPPTGWKHTKNPFGFKIVEGPKMDGLTHKMMAKVTNKFGGTSRIQLDSVKIESDSELERIFKGKVFSMIYVTEMSNFHNPNLFPVLEESLRMPHLSLQEHKLIGDTNPAIEGKKSWIWKLFFEFPNADEETLIDQYVEKGLTEPEKAKQLQSLQERQRLFAVHKFSIDDNIFYTEEQKRAQWTRYCDNPDTLARYYYGDWVQASSESIFQDVFRPTVHVVGDAEDSKKLEPEQMLPQEGCFQLATTYDPGDMNNSWQVVEKAFRKEIVNGKEMDVSFFKVLDEVIFIGEALPNCEIVPLVLAQMDYWESVIGTKVMWRHITDVAAFDRYSKIHDRTEALDVLVESDGRIELERGPAKKTGSIEARVKLLRKLLYQNRIYIGGHCTKTIEMLNNLKKGLHYAVDTKSKFKHAFDSLTYYLALECWNEMEHAAINLNTSAKASTGLSIVRL